MDMNKTYCVTMLFTIVTILMYFLVNKCVRSCEEKLQKQYAVLRKMFLLFFYSKPQRHTEL